MARRRFGEYAQEWLASRVDLKPTTRQQYAGTLRKLVLPELGGYALKELTSARVRSWYAELARSTNPAAQPCRIRGAGVARTAERPIATLTQVEALADAVYPRYRALVLLAAWTVARWGELIALTRDRFDLTAGQMRIDRQYVLLKAEGDQPARVVLQSPKTEPGRAGGPCTSRAPAARPRRSPARARPTRLRARSPTTRASRCTAGPSPPSGTARAIASACRGSTYTTCGTGGPPLGTLVLFLRGDVAR